jgi:pantoate--beta-alanine ligase
VAKPAETARFAESIADLRGLLEPWRRSGTIGLVPTMGALHAGHARLIEHARDECDSVVVSVFVNPLQFDRQDDLDGYPRSLQSDLALCERLNVDVVFAPSAEEMYPAPPLCTVEVSRIADHLCGRHRPGHFRGVATVVMKLFEIVQPNRAYFGEKDAQQLAIIRRLVRDFNVPVAIAGVPTVREPDGLAVSSRNVRLNADERKLAPVLYQALCEAQRQIAAGVREVGQVKAASMARMPEGEALKLEYLEIVDPEEMQPVERIDGPVCIAGALWVGSTRLIDNLVVPTAPGTLSAVRSAQA